MTPQAFAAAIVDASGGRAVVLVEPEPEAGGAWRVTMAVPGAEKHVYRLADAESWSERVLHELAARIARMGAPGSVNGVVDLPSANR